MDYDQKARGILSSISYATVATVNEDGSPWNSPVYCAMDDAYNCYWLSSLESRHSQNILRTHQVFIVIYDSTSTAGEGVYLQCQAKVIEDSAAVRFALGLLGNRRGKPFTRTERYMDGGPQRIFMAKPTVAWMNDAEQDEHGDFIRDYRVELGILADK